MSAYDKCPFLFPGKGTGPQCLGRLSLGLSDGACFALLAGGFGAGRNRLGRNFHGGVAPTFPFGGFVFGRFVFGEVVFGVSDCLQPFGREVQPIVHTSRGPIGLGFGATAAPLAGVKDLLLGPGSNMVPGRLLPSVGLGLGVGVALLLGPGKRTAGVGLFR